MSTSPKQVLNDLFTGILVIFGCIVIVGGLFTPLWACGLGLQLLGASSNHAWGVGACIFFGFVMFGLAYVLGKEARKDSERKQRRARS